MTLKGTLLTLSVPALAIAQCHTSLLTFKTYESPWPSKGLLFYAFAKNFGFTVQVLRPTGTLLKTVYPTVSANGYYSGLGYFCDDAAGTALPRWNGTDARVSGGFWLWQAKLESAKDSGGYGCWGYAYENLPVTAVTLQYNIQCPCYGASCPLSCIAQCDGTCRCTPIAIKFGRNYEFVALADGPSFRVLPTDQPMQMTWPTGKTGWLVHPVNGEVTSIQGELFDYPRLAAHDVNHDDRIDVADGSFFSELSVWFDRNQDGTAQSDELYSLSSLGVNGVSLRTHPLNWDNGEGTTVWLVSSVETKSKSCQAGDALVTVKP